jgi:hypothetical protein
MNAPPQIKKKIKQKTSTTKPHILKKKNGPRLHILAHRLGQLPSCSAIQKYVKVAFKTTNTIKHDIRARDKETDVYSLSGVYQIIRKECLLKYVGQTGRTFRTTYNEHIREIQKNGKPQNMPNIYLIQHISMMLWKTRLKYYKLKEKGKC